MENELKMPDEIYREIFKNQIKKQKKKKVDLSFFKSKNFFLSIVFLLVSSCLVLLNIGFAGGIISHFVNPTIEYDNVIPEELKLSIDTFRTLGENYITVTAEDVEPAFLKIYANAILFGGEKIYFSCEGSACTAKNDCISTVNIPIFSNKDYNTVVYNKDKVISEYKSNKTGNEILYTEVILSC